MHMSLYYAVALKSVAINIWMAYWTRSNYGIMDSFHSSVNASTAGHLNAVPSSGSTPPALRIPSLSLDDNLKFQS